MAAATAAPAAETAAAEAAVATVTTAATAPATEGKINVLTGQILYFRELLQLTFLGLGSHVPAIADITLFR